MTSKRAARTIRYTVIGLAVMGIYSALSPYIVPDALYWKLVNTLYGPDVAHQVPRQFEWPIQNLIHRLGGTLYMVLGVLQFAPTLRARRPQLHRWMGMGFILLSLSAAISGITMSITHGLAGMVEVVPSVFFGVLSLVTVGKAYLHVRRREFALHREWMIRTFAIGLGIVPIRILYVIGVQTTLLSARQLMGLSFWAGWLLALVVAESWIRRTRPARQPEPGLLQVA
jgi:uncharacterized membrane protein